MGLIESWVNSLSLEQAKRELLSLHVKYDERGMSMRDAGAVVRSIYVPAMIKLVDVLTEISNERKSFGACPGIAKRALEELASNKMVEL